MKKIIPVLFLTLLSILMNAQTIPASKRVTWAGSGVLPGNPVITNIANVMNFGAVGDGVANDKNAVDSAINSFGGHAGIVYFPTGTYFINPTLQIPDSIILRGNCSENSILKFDFGGAGNNCINAQVNVNTTYRAIRAGFSKDTSVIVVDSVTGFNVGDYLEINEPNGNWNTVPANWATLCVGQIVHITAINGNAISFQNPLRMSLTDSSQVRIWIPRKFVGIEDLGINRVDATTPAQGYCINFFNALNCWVRGVESNHSCGAHIFCTTCSNIEVTGCYFHHAFLYDGNNTRGYGIALAQHTGQCLIENNVFVHLRHAMMVKQGANGNVYAYNYATDGFRSESPSDEGGDIVCHGHYPYANLFEGNIVNNIAIDETWGPDGPYNTFYRNRAELYGIIMSVAGVNSDSLNFVGNEITNPGSGLGNYIITGTNHFEYGNNILGTITPSGTTNLNDTSYYRTTFSDIFAFAPFPPTVGEPNAPLSGTIPAKLRYQWGGKITTSPNAACNTLSVPEINADHGVSVFPNPAKDKILVQMTDHQNSYSLIITDMQGRKIYSENIPAGITEKTINISGFAKGMYFVRLANDKFVSVKKIVFED